MRAVMLEVDPKLVAERARLGLDHQDEMWQGKLHTVAGLASVACSEVIGCTFATADGPAVQVAWDGGEALVRHQ